MKVLLALSPLTQFNTPYPSTAYLTSYLEKLGHEVNQIDLGLELILKIFSKNGLKEITKIIRKSKVKDQLLDFYLDAHQEYENNIDAVISFLQKDESPLIQTIIERQTIPEGPRFIPLDDNQGGVLDLYNDLSDKDKAKHICSLFMDDLADIIRQGVDEDFGFSRYAEKIALSLTSYSPIYRRLKKKTIIDEWIAELTKASLQKFQPDVMGISVPFPGNLLGALRIAETTKQVSPNVKVLLGGGYVNTELRSLEDPRIFDLIDYITFDDGEKPLEHLLKFIETGDGPLLRTMYRKDNKVTFVSSPELFDIKFKNLDAPSFKGLEMNRYVSMMDNMNPTQRLWTDGRWNKMILAHGCYWKKCTFCDVSLDYIGRYEPDTAMGVVDKMEKIIQETGVNGFHFVDEAAPPTLLKAMSEEILKRNLKVTWWGNIRFDPYFSAEVTELMKKAGCIAVTGGIEVASERVLKLIDKGISIEKVAKVTKNFKDAGIFVHAYLMYGFPTQTMQETIDSLEVVRQLFKKHYLSSAYWHRFALTAHSPVGMNPDKFKVKIVPQKKPEHGLFANNELPFTEEKFVDHDMLGVGLRRALYNYMLGQGLDMDLRDWFDERVPRPKVEINF
ncbi:B12-binding domain-containing radical SAM protein [Peredibacter sp. HCB2-198]|uniref:B12-binding domain-containing radical SAM protein n=1 Tax=Peredibacter sp. HCB2-198 TaxID=3383025 RepID=UPI0038B5DB65